MLAKLVTPRVTEWDERLRYVLFSYRACQQASTGESPFFLMYGRDPRLPTEDVLSPSCDLQEMDLEKLWWALPGTKHRSLCRRFRKGRSDTTTGLGISLLKSRSRPLKQIHLVKRMSASIPWRMHWPRILWSYPYLPRDPQPTMARWGKRPTPALPHRRRIKTRTRSVPRLTVELLEPGVVAYAYANHVRGRTEFRAGKCSDWTNSHPVTT